MGLSKPKVNGVLLYFPIYKPYHCRISQFFASSPSAQRGQPWSGCQSPPYLLNEWMPWASAEEKTVPVEEEIGHLYCPSVHSSKSNLSPPHFSVFPPCALPFCRQAPPSVTWCWSGGFLCNVSPSLETLSSHPEYCGTYLTLLQAPSPVPVQIGCFLSLK